MAESVATEEKPELEPVALEQASKVTDVVETPAEATEAPAEATGEAEAVSEFTEASSTEAGFVKPWFLKTEDIYEVVKNAASDVKVGDVVLAERAVTVVDGFAVAIAKKVLRVSETEGFSIMQRMDELMVKILQGVDVSVDVLSIKFAEAVAQLQVAVLYHAEWTSDVVKEQAMQAKVAGEAMLVKMQETEQYKQIREKMDPAITGAVAVYGTADTSVRALVTKLEDDYPEAAARIKSLLVLPHPDQLSAANIISGVNTRVVAPVVAGSTAVYGAVAPQVQAGASVMYKTTVESVIPAAVAGTTAVVTGATTAYTATVDTVQNRVIPATIAGAIAASTACVTGSTTAYNTTRDTLQNTVIPATIAGATATYQTVQPACVNGATALYNRGTPVASALYTAALPMVTQMMERAQPYVHQAINATAPYVSKAAEAAQPAVDVATDITMPVIDKIVEAGKPLVQPALDNELVSGAIAGTVSAAEAVKAYSTPSTAPAPPAYTEDAPVESTVPAVESAAPVIESVTPVESAAPVAPPAPPAAEKEPEVAAPEPAPDAAPSSSESTPVKEMAAVSIEESSSPVTPAAAATTAEEQPKSEKKEKSEKKKKSRSSKNKN